MFFSICQPINQLLGINIFIFGLFIINIMFHLLLFIVHMLIIIIGLVWSECSKSCGCCLFANFWQIWLEQQHCRINWNIGLNLWLCLFDVLNFSQDVKAKIPALTEVKKIKVSQFHLFLGQLCKFVKFLIFCSKMLYFAHVETLVVFMPRHLIYVCIIIVNSEFMLSVLTATATKVSASHL